MSYGSDLLDQIKGLARENENQFSYNQRLEIITRLLTGKESFNHLSAMPDECLVNGSMTVADILSRFQLVEQFFESYMDSQNEPEFTGWNCFEAWEEAAIYWSEILDDDYPTVLDRLTLATDFDDIPLPVFVKDANSPPVKMIYSEAVPYGEKLAQVITFWFFHKEIGSAGADKYKFCLAAAEKYGLEESDRELYRSVCRESVNHSWSVNSMLSLGVLGNPEARLKKFDKDKIKDQIDAIWQHEEPAEQ